MKRLRANRPPPPPAEPPPRSLAVLLSALDCPAPGLVTIDRLPNPVTSDDGAGGSYKYWWGAKYGEHTSMIIRNTERDVLKRAGAEDELADGLWLAD
jgi:hypothetical protein